MTRPAAGDPPAVERLERLARRASAALVWEGFWRAAQPALFVLAAFLVVSWLGLWTETGRYARIAGGVGFGVAFLASLAGFVRLAWPARAAALARVDRDSGLPHRPATALDDRLANAHSDAATKELWALHRARVEKAALALKVAAPSPRLVDRDRYALRALALLAVAAAAFIAGPQKYARLAAAFDWRTPGAVAQDFRLDAWLDPPAYTGKPPLLLPAKPVLAAAEAAAAVVEAPDKPRRFTAPGGSTLVVRMSGDAGVTIEVEGGLKAPGEPKVAERPGDPAPRVAPGADSERRYTLTGDARLVLRRHGKILSAFEFSAIPDKAPTIALKELPRVNLRGSLSLSYAIGDDYGVVNAEARFARQSVKGAAPAGRSLVEPPRIGLGLPQAPGGLGDGQTTADLSEHPWAGARVAMTLYARDDAGNEGKSAESEFTLPQRPFTKPMAKALVELRRNLVLAPDENVARTRVGLEALMIAPEEFSTGAAVYLGLNIALTRLKGARVDADLVGVADFLWQMALRIEDGDVSEAERDLRAAQQALREALQRGASEEEIRKLMQDLRAALDKFMRELAEQQMRDQRGDRQQAERDDRNQRALTPRDLQNMLDRMEDMARSGNLAEAQRMLDQMQRMLENLQTARRDRSRDPQSREMSRQLGELDKMTREQQELRDKTYKDGQRQRRAQRNPGQRQQGQQGGERQRGQQQQGQPGDQGDEEEQGADDGGDGEEMSGEQLRERQEALRKRLEDLKNKMKQFGMNGEQGLDDAEQGMREAEGALGQGQQGRGRAVDAQGRALEGLRRGMQGLAQQMRRQPGGDPDGESDYADGDDWGNPDPNGRPRRADGNQRDPLNRPRRDEANRLQDYTGLNAAPGAAERARRVLEELRKRLGEPLRPREELDYLERLLKRY